MDEYNADTDRLAAVLSDDEEDSDPRVTVAQRDDEDPRATVAQGEKDVSDETSDGTYGEIETADLDSISVDSGNIEEQTGNIDEHSMDILEANPNDAEMIPHDLSETISDIVEKTVDAVISGKDADSVLEEVNNALSEIYSDVVDSGTDMETVTGMIADAVHEIASVFDSPDVIADSILSVLPDSDMVEAIRDRIEEVHADMTVESYGILGELTFDSEGLLQGTDEVNREAADVEVTGVDVDSTIMELDSHMEAVSMEPEFQDLISSEEWAQDLEAEKLKDTQPDLDMDAGMDILEPDFPEVTEADVSYDPDPVDW